MIIPRAIPLGSSRAALGAVDAVKIALMAGTADASARASNLPGSTELAALSET